MGGTRKSRWSWGACALVFGMFALGGSVAVAATPEGNTFTGCSNSSTGALRLINPSKGGACTSSENFVRWTRWNFRNLWISSTKYAVGDLVQYNGQTYIARVVPPVGTLPTNINYWGLVAARGSIGPQGLIGATGLQGVIGPIGPIGPRGLQGLVGEVGPTGLPGLPGATGLPGIPGATGLTGPTGVQGLLGPTGVQGLPGLPGVTGATGLAGITGATGLPGITGATGLTGATGATGVVDAIFAKINANGTLAYGNHVSSSSVSGPVLPTYTINFDQNVSQCAVNAVSGQALAVPVITVHGPTSVNLTFALLTSVLTQTPFEVTVTC